MEENIRVLDYLAFGKLVARWAADEASRPKSLAEFKEATHGILELPNRITGDPTYPQWTLDNLVIRLPPPELVEQLRNVITRNPEVYPYPPFYDSLVNRSLVGDSALLARIGDYTIAHCAG